jgi:hypothetical protein
LGYSIDLSLIEHLPLSTLEEAQIGYLQSEVDLLVHTGYQLVKLAHLGPVYIKDRTRLLEELTTLLLDLIILETDVTQAVLALLWCIEKGKYSVLQGRKTIIAIMGAVLLQRFLFRHPNYIYIQHPHHKWVE